MILGIGCDLIEIERIEGVISRFGDSFLERLFTPVEIDYCTSIAKPALRFAGRFAAKEATAKALACGIGSALSWLDMEIRNNEAGKPFLILNPTVSAQFGVARSHISISHSTTLAMAYVILEGEWKG